jgi:hypothetical protein
MYDASQCRLEFFAARDQEHHTYYNFRVARNVFRAAGIMDNEARVRLVHHSGHPAFGNISCLYIQEKRLAKR